MYQNNIRMTFPAAFNETLRKYGDRNAYSFAGEKAMTFKDVNENVGGLIAFLETTEIPLAGTPIVIRSKTHAGAPMTTSDAIDQMELVGHDFFLFHDSESDLPSAVYRRRGWTYGVIHLEAIREPRASFDARSDAIEESA